MKRHLPFALTTLRLLLISICAMSLTSCISGLNKESDLIVKSVIATPAELMFYTSAFKGQIGRWPNNYSELTSFAHNSFFQQTNEPPPLQYCQWADFTELTNGSLQIHYVVTAPTIQPQTNQIIVEPPKSTEHSK
jgi:hypothetical protein